ncbi:MAG: hypothetical protein U5R31_12690 [Acidimicrobiia bacterium]|nr:hypothetical protein [Acidimicrobiia bacterium]
MGVGEDEARLVVDHAGTGADVGLDLHHGLPHGVGDRGDRFLGVALGDGR